MAHIIKSIKTFYFKWTGCNYLTNQNFSKLNRFGYQKIELNIGYRHSSVEYSAPTIQPPRVRVPSTPSTLSSFVVFLLYLSCEKNENKQKEDGFGPFFLKKIITLSAYLIFYFHYSHLKPAVWINYLGQRQTRAWVKTVHTQKA